MFIESEFNQKELVISVDEAKREDIEGLSPEILQKIFSYATVESKNISLVSKRWAATMMDLSISRNIGRVDELYQFLHQNVKDGEKLLENLDGTKDALARLREQSIQDVKAYLSEYKEHLIKNLMQLNRDQLKELYNLSKDDKNLAFTFKMIASARIDSDLLTILAFRNPYQRDMLFSRAVDGIIRANRLDLAIRMTSKYVNKDKQIDSYINISQKLAEQGRIEEACQLAKKVTELIGKRYLEVKGKQSWKAYQVIVDHLMRNNDYEQAIDVACKIPLEAVQTTEIATARSYVLHKIIKKLTSIGDFEMAIDAAMKIPEDHAFRKKMKDEAFMSISSLYAKIDDFENAKLTLEFIGDKVKRNSQRLRILGIYLEKGFVKNASTYVNTFEDKETQGRGLHSIARYHIDRNEVEKALKTALKISPDAKSLMSRDTLRDSTIEMIAFRLHKKGMIDKALELITHIDNEISKKRLEKYLSRH